MKRKAHFHGTLAAQTGFERYMRKSRREEFLSLMDAVVPWRELEALIVPHYPKAGETTISNTSSKVQPSALQTHAEARQNDHVFPQSRGLF